MNNNAVANLPDVPGANAPWIFYTKLRGCTQDFGATAALRFKHQLARRTLLTQLDLMSHTRCKACSGYGHRSRDCPTNLRLGMLGSSTNEWKRLTAWTRKQVDTTENERIADFVQAPAFHSVPM